MLIGAFFQLADDSGYAHGTKQSYLFYNSIINKYFFG